MKDLSCITDELKDLDPYELHRLSVWINNELRQAKVINSISNTFKVGDVISWFNTRTNSEINATVESKGRSYVTVRIPNGEIWEIAYHSINIKKLTPALPNNYNFKLTKNDFKVGEDVEFIVPYFGLKPPSSRWENLQIYY